MSRIIKYLSILIIYLFCAQAVYSQSVENYYQNGRNLLYSGKYEEAIIEFNNAILLDPFHADSFYYRGVSKAHMDDYESASIDINRALEINKESAKPYARRLASYNDKSELRRLIASSTSSVNSNPRDGKAYQVLGVAEIKLGDQKGGCTDISNANRYG